MSNKSFVCLYFSCFFFSSQNIYWDDSGVYLIKQPIVQREEEKKKDSSKKKNYLRMNGAKWVHFGMKSRLVSHVTTKPGCH